MQWPVVCSTHYNVPHTLLHIHYSFYPCWWRGSSGCWQQWGQMLSNNKDRFISDVAAGSGPVPGTAPCVAWWQWRFWSHAKCAHSYVFSTIFRKLSKTLNYFILFRQFLTVLAKICKVKKRNWGDISLLIFCHKFPAIHPVSSVAWTSWSYVDSSLGQ